METFIPLVPLEDNPSFSIQRDQCLRSLIDTMIDPPILPVVRGLNMLPFCFTLQSCYGHFVYPGQNDPSNTQLLPVDGSVHTVEYRIAYLALCIDKNPMGQELLDRLKSLENMDRSCIQVGCAQWFRDMQINSYVVQVEPQRFKQADTAVLGIEEALHVEKIKALFFRALGDMLKQDIRATCAEDH